MFLWPWPESAKYNLFEKCLEMCMEIYVVFKQSLKGFKRGKYFYYHRNKAN